MVLDQEAFQRASKRLSDLTRQIQELENMIEEMIRLVEQGMNTPAGRKLAKLGRDGLKTSIDDQKAVIQHVSETLEEAKRLYDDVFNEFTALNNKLNSYNY